ncbi:carboxymuconolactone decarboxylase family protein [Halobacterium bonnevillei]|uniref:Carboxymuconolactone decarboxylase family protein n=1 Tax=Halobacterium bonnevillei TaxID=2692200 RepID=A0A6B0SHC5_9EURY|nr:carboxymuconolactone decarboxylase family protein [Halobacterium bonnevillei]MXR19281.1 carboxymuconolactone decarboxylase family protein [Halobacterium bonnevillei]
MISMANSTQELEAFKANLGEFSEQAPEIENFLGFVESAEATETLDRKTKELMSLAIGVAVRCEPCILWHTDAALDAGASPEEVDDALKVAVAMGGGPALAYATKAHQVLQELSE